MYLRFPAVIVAVISCAATGGCGLIDSDVANFDLSMPEREFTVDTAQWELSGDATFPAVDCAEQPTICGDAVAATCAGELCSGRCGEPGTCEAVLALQLWSTIDLFTEKPELQTINEQPLVTVTLDRVYYELSDNTLNVDIPALTIYVAPQTVMSPDDASAIAIGTIAATPAGQTVAAADVVFTENGEDALKDAMRDYQTPFNLLVGSELVVAAGAPVPMGRAVATIHVEAHAGL